MARITRLPPSRAVAAAALGLILSACAADRTVTGSTYPYDHRERHPIVLAQGMQTLDVFVGAGIGRRQRDDIHAFAAEYRRHGSGPILAQVPAGPGLGGASHFALDGIRAAFAEAGLSDAPLAVSAYPVADPTVASAIRLSFRRLQAKVATKCGLWPRDLGTSDLRSNARNEPYWNHGCAVQSNLANQVADPIDLVRGRPEDGIDTIRRTKAIDSLRQAKDPSTQYRQDGQGRINSAVGN